MNTSVITHPPPFTILMQTWVCLINFIPCYLNLVNTIGKKRSLRREVPRLYNQLHFNFLSWHLSGDVESPLGVELIQDSTFSCSLSPTRVKNLKIYPSSFSSFRMYVENSPANYTKGRKRAELTQTEAQLRREDLYISTHMRASMSCNIFLA